MMKKSHRLPSSKGIRYYLPIAVFLLSVLTSTAVTWYVTGNIIDSDASSELVLSQHLAQTRQLLSQDWLYSTELRVFQMQWVFAPLMLLLSDWHLVRFLGAMILQGFYILSYAYMTQQAGFRRQTFWYGAALLLLPVSVAYGRIVLYHTHYLLNITASFFIYGLVIDLYQTWNPRLLRSWLLAGALMLLSFLSGANSLRQLMITFAPMLFSIFLLCLRQDTSESRSATVLQKPVLRLLTFALLAAACSFAALQFNKLVLHKYYTDCLFYNESTVLIDPSLLDDMVYGYLHQFGFRRSVPLLSLFGILSVGSVVANGYALYTSGKRLFQASRNRLPPSPRSLILLGFFSYSAVMAVVFLITTNESCYFPLYLTLCWPWAVAPLVENLADNPAKYSPLHKNRIFAWITALVVLSSGWLNLAWFTGLTNLYQPYEGLLYQERDTKAQLSGVTAFLSENGYQIGYATYWNANVVTEITNGAVRMIGIYERGEPGNVAYHDLLTSLQLREIPNEKPFLLMQVKGEQGLPPAEMASYCTLAYADDWYCIYDITDLEAFRSLLYA